jgi:nucleotide-binding universal stress UspA family protein
LAREFDAHLAGIAFAYDPVVPLIAGVGEGVPPAWLDAQRAEAQDAAETAIVKFEEGIRRTGLSGEPRLLNASAVGAADLFGRAARVFDLSIVRQAEPDKLGYENLIIEAALFDSGRPVLIVPYIQQGGFKVDRVMVCWNGSRPAARAVGDAMPLLARAKVIEIVTVETGAGSDEIFGADIAHHLARHRHDVELKRIVALNIDVPNIILSHAADSSADFIVMGGYGHSRLREFVLGGATRGILASMTVPTLMSH